MPRPNSRFAFVPRLLLVLALVGAAFAVWHFAIRDRAPAAPPVPEEAYAANTMAVGLMEQFKYAEAADAFRDIVAKYPKWIPGRVNLAISLLHASEGQTDEIASILTGVLQDDPLNPYAHYTLGVLPEVPRKV